MKTPRAVLEKNAAWRKANREKDLLSKRNYYAKNKRKLKAYVRAWCIANPHKVKQYRNNSMSGSPGTVAKYLYRTSKARAKRYKIPFSITPADIVVPTHCPILNVPLCLEYRPRDPYRPSVDRIDNTRGYEPGNVAVISMRANTIKRDLTIELAERLLTYMRGTK